MKTKKRRSAKGLKRIMAEHDEIAKVGSGTRPLVVELPLGPDVHGKDAALVLAEGDAAAEAFPVRRPRER